MYIRKLNDIDELLSCRIEFLESQYEKSSIYHCFNVFKAKAYIVHEKNVFFAIAVVGYLGRATVAVFFVCKNENLPVSLFFEVVRNLSQLETGLKYVSFAIITQREKQEISKSFTVVNNGQFYPSEFNCPTVVYWVDKSNRFSKSVTLFTNCRKETNTFPLFLGSGFSLYRYTVRRLKRCFPTLLISEIFEKEEYLNIVTEWEEKVVQMAKMNQGFFVDKKRYSLGDYYSFWYYPIVTFLEMIPHIPSKYKLVHRKIESGAGHRGFWVGVCADEVLNVYLFVTNRKRALFADMLLVDILNFSFRNDIAQVNLGGAEDETLYKFKSKFLPCFGGSFQRKIFDVVVSM